MVLPMRPDLPPIRPDGRKQQLTMANPLGAHTRGCLCRGRSSPTSFVDTFSNLLPGSPSEMRLQARSFERSLSEPKSVALLAFGYNQSESFFHEGFGGCSLLGGQFAGLFKKTIGYLHCPCGWPYRKRWQYVNQAQVRLCEANEHSMTEFMRLIPPWPNKLVFGYTNAAIRRFTGQEDFDGCPQRLFDVGLQFAGMLQPCGNGCLSVQIV